jgi:prepilin-type N-terminal cleavage/methylation domain-containing protein
MNTRPPISRPGIRRRSGFTLVEVLIGLALFSMLVGGIFAVQKGALEVSREVVESETRTLRMHSFCELLRRTFEQMPGNAKVNLRYYGGSGSDLTEVAFTDYPLALNWPGVTAGAKTVIFRTERSVGIGLRAAILYLDEEQADSWTKKNGDFDETKILARITIMDGIAALGWRFYDDSLASPSQAGRTEEAWVNEWLVDNTRRPSEVEMALQFMDGSDPVKLVFWIPTMISPQQFTTGLGAPTPQNPQIPKTPKP